MQLDTRFVALGALVAILSINSLWAPLAEAAPTSSASAAAAAADDDSLAPLDLNSLGSFASGNTRAQDVVAVGSQVAPSTATIRRTTSAAEDESGSRRLVRRRRSILPIRRSQLPYPSPASSYNEQRALAQQLPELIAQARNDKAFERALLKMLINARLRSALSSQAQPPNSAAESFYPFDGQSAAPLDQPSDGAAAAAQPARLISSLEQLLVNYPGFVDQSSAVSSNDLNQLADAYAGQLAIDKREFKPCSFNAISCAKNPFRTNN